LLRWLRVFTLPFTRQAFKAFNQSGGFLNQTDLRAVLEKMGETVSEEELAALVREMDIDGDGEI
jgi:Ca2+-binding EF-hand superfamily protein